MWKQFKGASQFVFGLSAFAAACGGDDATMRAPPAGHGQYDAGGAYEGGASANDGGTSDADGQRTDASPPPPPSGKPGPSNTGPIGVTLKTYTDSCDIGTAGSVLDGFSMPCDTVSISAPNVTIRHSSIRGNVFVSKSGAGFTLEDSSMGVGGAISSANHVTLRRNDIHGPGDGLHITSDSGAMCDTILLEGNWIHDPKPDPTDHYDGIQVRGVKNLTLRGNNIDTGTWTEPINAVFYLEDANGGDDQVVVDGNWFNGGGYVIYTSGTNVQITNNRIGRGARWGLLYSPYVPFAESGNVWEDTGAPMRFQ